MVLVRYQRKKSIKILCRFTATPPRTLMMRDLKHPIEALVTRSHTLELPELELLLGTCALLLEDEIDDAISLSQKKVG